MLFKIRGTKNLCKNRGLLDAYGGPDGLEPATSGVTGRHSNQLNYRSVKAYSLMVGGTGIEPVTLAL